MNHEDWGLHWFRRDLRVQGNSSLIWSAERHQGRVLGVFFFDSTFLERPDFSHSRFAFFIDTLIALKDELKERGGDLLVLDSRPQVGFPDLLKKIETAGFKKPTTVTFNRDYEPFARHRDETVTEILKQDCGLDVQSHRDHLLIEPDELFKSDGKNFYQVYTPFSKRWLELFREKEIQSRIEESMKWPHSFSLSWDQILNHEELESLDKLLEFKKRHTKNLVVPIPRAGSRAALKCLGAFRSKLSSYKEQRDIPGVRGTSQLSIFLKNGSITTAQAISELGLGRESLKLGGGAECYLKELIWREFYYHILWHCPRVEHEAFLQRYNSIVWENREDLFDCWKSGKTGYAIVDAGMRQLNATGWMHNRVRMIVASFLVKDLHIDWRWGERYFMEKLLDGDLAPNNGGWQWAASTGCDPQPYFRVFNPTLQSEKFDPDGVYIKKWVTERENLLGKALHSPVDPIVDHASRRLMALSLYK